jgi:hypothetical protein
MLHDIAASKSSNIPIRIFSDPELVKAVVGTHTAYNGIDAETV